MKKIAKIGFILLISTVLTSYASAPLSKESLEKAFAEIDQQIKQINQNN